VSAFFTVIVYGIQLLFGMQQYKNDKKELEKKILLRKYVNPSSTASDSVHYPGFLVGYMAWGFVISFHLILLILIGIRVLYLQIHHVKMAFSIIIPVIIIYLLKSVTLTTIGEILFISRKKKDKKVDKPKLKNPSSYAIFIYFVFFAGKIEQ